MKYALVLVAVCFLSFQNFKYTRVNIAEGINLKMPTSFTPVAEGQMINRHVHFRRPQALFTDQNGEIDLSINQNPTRWRESDIEILKDFQKSSILNLYDDVSFSREEIVDIKGRKFAVFEFVSSVSGNDNSFRKQGALRKYTYIQYTVYNGSTLVLNFSSPSQSQRTWAPVAREIMNSISLK